MLPLASGLLTSFIRQDPVLAKDFRTAIRFVRQEPETIIASYEDPAVLGFSTYVWNFRQSLEVARLAKERFAHAPIVFGGPSAPRYDVDINRFFQQYPFVDILAHGEGELTFAELLHALRDHRDLRTVPGISFRSPEGEKGYVTNPARERIKDLGVVPSPFLNGVFDELLWSYREYITGTIWETNRGCPFSCAFCDWGQATQSKVNIHELERLKQELDWMSRNRIPYIFAADANFGIKERDIEIARYMGNLYATTGYPRYLQINWMKNSQQKTIDIADTFKRSGMGFMVTLSMQSFDKDTLIAIKRDNIALETFAGLKREYNARGIDTYSELLLGLAGETYESFTDGLMQVISPLLTDHFALYLTNVLPNAEMAKPEYREKYGLVTRMTKSTVLRQRVRNRYVQEMDETIVGTKAMPVEDWRRAFTFGYLLRMFHNMRTVFYVIEFLREHYGVSPKVYLEYIIAEGRRPGRAGGIAKLLQRMDDYADSILAGQTTTLAHENYPEYFWEPHEMSFAVAFQHGVEFYRDIRNLTIDFVCGQKLKTNVDLILDICRYQEAISPLIRRDEPVRVKFEYDVLTYFNAVLKQEKGLEIFKDAGTLNFQSSYHPSRQDTGLDYLLWAIRSCASGSLPFCEVHRVEATWGGV